MTRRPQTRAASEASASQASASQVSADIPGIDLEAAAENSQKSVTAFAHLHSRAFRNAMKFNAEVLDFARRRVGADIETSDRLCQCETVTDAMKVMSDFYQNAFNDYAEQTATMLRSGTELSAQTAGETIAEAERLNGRH